MGSIQTNVDFADSVGQSKIPGDAPAARLNGDLQFRPGVVFRREELLAGGFLGGHSRRRLAGGDLPGPGAIA